MSRRNSGGRPAARAPRHQVQQAPADSAPVAVLPAEALPAEALPAEALPAEALPAEVLPAEVLPADVVPAQRAPGAAGGRCLLELEGELTIHTASDRRATLLSMIDTDVELAVDLSEVTELDTAGLQLLLMAQREAAHLGGRLTVTAVSRSVLDVLAIAHLDSSLRHLAGATDAEARR